MAEYKTPGVYIEEKSTMSPSVAGVETAIPAFIGFTESGPKNTPVAIENLLEYQNIFGKGSPLTVNEDGDLCGQEYCLFDSMRLFYDNGGADCYVISIGTYDETKSGDIALLYKNAIDKLDEVDDVTMLVFPDAATILTDDTYGTLASVHQYALQNCARLKSRFAILDLNIEDDLATALDNFRSGVALDSETLSYGAAYYPYLKTSYVKDIPFEEVIKVIPRPEPEEEEKVEENEDNIIEGDPLDDVKDPVEDVKEPVDDEEKEEPEAVKEPTIWEEVDAILANESDPERALKISAIIPRIDGYAQALASLQDKACVIPPSGAIAGLYAATDKRVGVWQAPANIGVSAVKGLTQLITDNQQAKMNVDPKTSKSVNAIRFFKGKGILVWGSRTLNAGSNEWRYVPVRRLFNYVEQSVKLSTYWAVFQPNDTNTWTKINCQISNFLNTLWRDGALAGASPDEAYFVEVGRGITMTQADIDNGYLIVRVGLAAVRPAEFIVLQFSHKVQE
ncbi:MAG: phage tail sheath family protein [Bacteroidales bacterium]|nr:phage tail sheath family protein [Bacteroidales bacterium]